MKFGLILGLSLAASSLFAARPNYLAYRSFQREFAETKAFADLGVPLRAFGVCNTDNMLGKPYSDYPPVWEGRDRYNWQALDDMVGDLVKASPKASFICLLDLNSPRWLARKMSFDSFDAVTHAACHPLWRAETKRYLAALVDRIESRWGDRVCAYLLMGGQTTEWFEHVNHLMTDHKNAAWREWCRKRGFDGGKLPPSTEELSTGAFEGVMFDPATQRAQIEYWKFHNSLTADSLLDFAHVVRARVGTKKEIGSFFGYYFICNKHLATQAHLDYERVIASPDIDFVTSPATYTDRACGFGTGVMAVSGTLRRYGKRVFHEIDFWPNTKFPPWQPTRPAYWKTDAETLAGDTREGAFALVNGSSSWWFDMWGGMYVNPELRRRIARFAELNARFGATLPPPEADVLVVADPDSAYAIVDPAAKCPDGFRPALGCGEQLRNVINRIGVTYDTCSFNDLAALDLSRVKLVCLPASWTLSPEKERLLRTHVLKDGRTVLWTYAPGVSDGRTLDVRRVAAFAGVPFKTPGVVTTPRDGWTAVYAYDWQKLTPEAMRGVAEKAGCFCYTDELLPVCSNGRLLAVHSGTGGVKTIRLPRRAAQVIDLFSGRVVAQDVAQFEDAFAEPDTKLYELK